MLQRGHHSTPSEILILHNKVTWDHAITNHGHNIMNFLITLGS